MSATLQGIRNDIRAYTGTDISQLPDSQLDAEIDTFYTIEMPFDTFPLRLQKWHEFDLIPNKDTYDISQDFLVIERPFYCAGWPVVLFDSPSQFYSYYPQAKSLVNLTFGDGGTTYSFNAIYFPIIPGTAMVSSGIESLNDDGQGQLFSEQGGTGTIDYLTGAINVNFAIAVGTNTQITGEWQSYVAAQPRSVLFFEHKLVFRPVPNKAYVAKFQVTYRPSALLNASDEPLYKEWADIIALGTSLRIFMKRGDLDMYTKYKPLYEQYKNLYGARDTEQLTNERMPSRYYRKQNLLWTSTLYPYR